MKRLYRLIAHLVLPFWAIGLVQNWGEGDVFGVVLALVGVALALVLLEAAEMVD